MVIRVFLCEFNPICLSGTEPTAMEPGNNGAGPFNEGVAPDHPAAERSGQSAAPEDWGDANVIERAFRQFSGLLQGRRTPEISYAAAKKHGADRPFTAHQFISIDVSGV